MHVPRLANLPQGFKAWGLEVVATLSVQGCRPVLRLLLTRSTLVFQAEPLGDVVTNEVNFINYNIYISKKTTSLVREL